VAGAISPDARSGHPGLRSLGGTLAFALRATLGFPTPLDWHRPPLANPYSVRVLELEKGTGTSLRSEPGPFSIEAPRREPGGRRAVGPPQPPEARARVHYHKAQHALTTKQPQGAFAGSRGDGGPLGLPAPDSRKPSTTNPPNPRSPPPKLGASPCRVVRTLAAGFLPSARSMLAHSRHPCLHSPATPAPRHGPTPRAPASGTR